MKGLGTVGESWGAGGWLWFVLRDIGWGEKIGVGVEDSVNVGILLGSSEGVEALVLGVRLG